MYRSGMTENIGSLYLIPIEYTEGSVLHWNIDHNNIDCGELETIHLITWDLDYIDAPWGIEISFDHNWYVAGITRSISKETLAQFRERCLSEKKWADIMIFNGLGADETLEELEYTNDELEAMIQVLNEVIEHIDFSKFSVSFIYKHYYLG